MDTSTPFYRDPERRLIAGICAGLAKRLNTEPTWIRLALAVLVLLTGGILIWAYLIMWAITPIAPNGVAPFTRWMGRVSQFFGGPDPRNPIQRI